ncbi:magnesium/cobalt transporter CorA [Paenibacillus sp. GSMTC-2017]|uniref:magnesium/cobalt transporter CorA n=1 Tax=Paenibacillus sp. GSMTC-2017 TaxID=2794350 RepID=UPI0018D7324C|nr:magnesium/cobalt transporter CorA [Paenibacillus sp. GSMTC-2017]MBH5319255.1 magnesium/cobalt transporter CorA [Paenibacillus sp. GSMTC-2017]
MKIRHVNHGVFTQVDEVEQALIAPNEGFYWIDADVEDLVILQPLFGMHDLAVEDCLNEEEQRPKIEIYENHYFIVANSIRFDDEEIFLRALNIFLGRHFIITVTKQKINELRYLKPILWEQEVSRPDQFLYYLIDLVVDNYFLVGDRIDTRIETLEVDILMHTKKSHLNEIIGLRSEILWVKKMLGAQRELVFTLNKKELKLIDDQLQKYFSDVYENALKIAESFETYRDLMGNLREAYQSSLSSRANEIMRVFTAITTIFMPLTFLTGIYGMNFDDIPGLHYRFGAYILLALMVFLGCGMFFIFRKKEWL